MQLWRMQVVKGTWVKETLITCETPSFEKFGAGDVIVKVSIGTDGYTVHRVKFSYFVNTKSTKCIAFGPGVLEQGFWGIKSSFIIQARM